jgi:hypothetical protein
MHISGPLNLRPYLDKDWVAKGGAGDVFLAISFFFHQLPFMTLGATRGQDPTTLRLVNEAPPFADLLTFDRFLHRANLIKIQAQQYLKHSFFVEIAMGYHVGRTECSRMVSLEWMRSVQEGTEADPGATINLFHDSSWVSAHGGASMGDVSMSTLQFMWLNLRYTM